MLGLRNSALGILILATLSVRGNTSSLPLSSTFLHTRCDSHRRIYGPLIDNQLAAYREGLLVSDIIRLDGPSDPIVLVYNNTVSARQTPALNHAGVYVPLLRDLAKKVLLPDVVVAGNVWDFPEDDTFKQGGPWFGFCNLMFMTTNLLLPYGLPVTTRDHLSCGEGCEPFTASDHRMPKAIFLGSSTGWVHGKRNAVVLAGILHNDSVYSGYTEIHDVPDSLLQERPELLELKPVMSLTDQVQNYKYIINADGHCAAVRMQSLLLSDSAVFWIETNQVEWFYPLLLPYVHYIPVRDIRWEPEDPLLDIVSKIAWAEKHPDKVAAIVRNANHFALTHLSDHALTCYSVQLLDEYAGLLRDRQLLHHIAQAGDFRTNYTDYRR